MILSARTPAKDAASLIIYRGQAESIQVLMGRRREKANFAPGIYVFPGGVLEASDRALALNSNIRTEHLAASATKSIETLAITAIRETWEETGLLLAQNSDLSWTNKPAWTEWLKQSLEPAPQHLRYLGRAITPSSSLRRFHARFFVSPYEYFQGSLIKNGELLDLRWFSVSEALRLPIYDVTEIMLAEFQRFLTDKRRKTPVISYRNERTLIRYE